MFCSNCNKKIKHGRTHCDKCGRVVQLEGVGALDAERLQGASGDCTLQTDMREEEARTSEKTLFLPIILSSMVIVVALALMVISFYVKQADKDTKSIYNSEAVKTIRNQNDAKEYIGKTLEDKTIMYEFLEEEKTDDKTEYKFKQVVLLDEDTKVDVFGKYISVVVPQDGKETLQNNCVKIENDKELKKQKAIYDNDEKREEIEESYVEEIKDWLKKAGYDKTLKEKGDIGIYCEGEKPFMAIRVVTRKDVEGKTKKLTFIVKADTGEIVEFPDDEVKK